MLLLSSATKNSSSSTDVLLLLKWRRTTAEIVALLAIQCSKSRGNCFMIAVACGEGGTKLVYGVGMQYGMDSSDAARARYCVIVILKVH